MEVDRPRQVTRLKRVYWTKVRLRAPLRVMHHSTARIQKDAVTARMVIGNGGREKGTSE
jgi:hypothetical protein